MASRIGTALQEAEMQGFAAELPRILRLKAQAEIQGGEAQAARKNHHPGAARVPGAKEPGRGKKDPGFGEGDNGLRTG